MTSGFGDVCELGAASAKAGSADALSLWAGQGVNAIRETPAADLVRTLCEETREARALLQKRMG